MAALVKAPVAKKAFTPKASLSGEGFLVKCPGCGGVFHETTSLFESDRPASGVMFILLPTYGASGANWQSFPYQEEVKFDALTCPGCGCSYTQGGSYVSIVPKESKPDIDVPALDHELHLEYKEMVDQGLFAPIPPEELAAAEAAAADVS